MKIIQITTDNRAQLQDYGKQSPYFGTAPTALLQGFEMLPDEVEVHVISVTRQKMHVPVKLGQNIWFHEITIPSWGMGRSLFMGASMAIRSLIHELQPDIVHGQGTERECALAAVLSGYPNVITIHGNMRVHAARGENRGKIYYRMAALLEYIALRKTHGVISISSYTDELVSPLTSRTWLLPNAAEASYFDASPEPADPPTLLFVGGLDERKNPVGFIHACGDIISKSGWRLRLCGSGDPSHPTVKELNELASIHSWIELAGWKSREQLLAEMEKATLLVLPTFEDNCPMVILEAMAAGLPVIASKVGGVPDLVQEGITGLMFDPNIPTEMRACLATLINEPETRTRLGNQARIIARERFHPQVIAKEHLRIYREVLGR